MNQPSAKNQINEWYHTYSNDIYRFTLFMTGDHEQAKDLVQETFLRAYSRYDSYEGKNEKSWLFGIAHNATVDVMRKKRPVVNIADLFPAVKATGETPEQAVMWNESERQLYLALGRMKHPYREVIVLRKIKGFSIRETAGILGWHENKVKMTSFRGMKMLKKELIKEGYHHEPVWRGE